MKSSLPPFWERFKFLHREVEEAVSSQDGSYKGLGEEALYTSDEDLFAIFNHPLVQGTFVDLGCGTGKAALFYGSLFPERRAVGIEFEASRMGLGRSFGLANVDLLLGDLLTCPIPQGNTYFLYFPTGPVLDRILRELYDSRKEFHLVVIESHGHLIPRISIENWLRPVAEIPLKSLRHSGSAIVFQRKLVERSIELYPFDLTYQDFTLHLQDGDEVWLGETRGMEWESGDRFELKTPPRTIYWKNVTVIHPSSEIDDKFRLAVELRPLGELSIQTSHGFYQGSIRKIIVSPVFRLELSSGQKVEWSSIRTISQGTKLCYESSLEP